jgi:zinc/manganese transport system substrate-binding protein
METVFICIWTVLERVMGAETVRIAAIRAAAALAVLAIGFAAAGCGQDTASQGPQQASVVASTDVWGSVASAVAGQHAKVKSILNSAVDDPHSYEASPADAAAITDASLVVYNGGGYDHWVDDVLANAKQVQAVNAYSLLDAAALGEPTPANEHVFYDPGTAKAVATQIAERLAGVDGAHAADYRANAAEFGRGADALLASEQAIAATHPSASVIATEPVAHYLLVHAGVADRTPATFVSAVEEGHDPSPADVAAVLDAINSHQVSALLLNPQTETPVTKQIADAARQARVPVVTVTETLPQGTDYLTWQRQTVDQLAQALQTNR